jgi:signal transduction histidine kinase
LTEELEEKNRQLAKKNRLADLGQMAGHVAHEVRNHLVPLTLYLSLLRRRLGLASGTTLVDGENAAALGLVEKLESNIDAMRNMVQDLLNFTANRQPQRQSVDLQAVVSELLTEIQEQCRAQQIGLRHAIGDVTEVVVDGEMLRSALRNLLLNAVDALGQGGTIEVGVDQTEHGWQISVRDDGEGIPAEVRQRIFDPFYTTKSTGTGLGLSVVERVMESHGGWVSLEPRQPRGTSACLHFPLWVAGSKD